MQTLEGTIREARPGDVGELCEAALALYARLGELGFLFKADEKNIKKDIENRLDSKFLKIYIYEERNRLAGFINLSIIKGNSNFEGTGLSGFINELFVKEGFRGKKIGAALMEKAFGFFAAKSVRRVQVHSVVSNGGAIRFYKNQGFKEDYISFIKILE